ncbi:hypothetical protein PUN28_004278 [Cardiocondyla obscurior]|uniref:Uncharacterized protein n=1 Tax=Cardiocondyla obscurior TaxID=286306 RepID=A0AAW2GG32_9HYME
MQSSLFYRARNFLLRNNSIRIKENKRFTLKNTMLYQVYLACHSTRDDIYFNRHTYGAERARHSSSPYDTPLSGNGVHYTPHSSGSPARRRTCGRNLVKDSARRLFKTVLINICGAWR